MSRHMTPAAICPAHDRITCETTDEGLRAVTSQTAPQTMYDTTMDAAPRIALRTMSETALTTTYETALRTKDQTTVQTTS